MPKHSDASIIDAWSRNTDPWTAAVRSGEIESRVLVTNAAIVEAVRARAPRLGVDLGCGAGWLVRALPEVEMIGVDALAGLVEQARTTEEAPKPRIVLRPKAIDEVEFTVKVEGGSGGNIYRIRGAKPERWVAQTDFTNDEAVGFLADRLAKIGIEDQLFAAGAVPGSTVVIGGENGVVFDWEPALASAAELMTSPRGTDARLDRNARPTRSERREHYFERMDAKAEARAELERERQAGLWKDDETQ